jgi:hypothetical protein
MYHHALLLRLLGIALVLCAWIACRLLVRGRRRIHPQVAVPIPNRVVHSGAIEQCMAKEAATRPSLPVH